MDNVFPNVVEESISIHYSPGQDWCYLDRQMDTEVIIFQGGDSDLGNSGGSYCSIVGDSHCAERYSRRPALFFPRSKECR